MEEYRKFSANLAVTEAAQRRLFLEQQVAQTKERLVMAEEALKRRQQSSGAVSYTHLRKRACVATVRDARRMRRGWMCDRRRRGRGTR